MVQHRCDALDKLRYMVTESANKLTGCVGMFFSFAVVKPTVAPTMPPTIPPPPPIPAALDGKQEAEACAPNSGSVAH